MHEMFRSSLPSDCMCLQIFDHFPLHEAIALSRVCSHWNFLLNPFQHDIQSQQVSQCHYSVDPSLHLGQEDEEEAAGVVTAGESADHLDMDEHWEVHVYDRL